MNMTFETKPVAMTFEGKSTVFYTTLRDIAATYSLLKREVFDPLNISIPELYEIRIVARHRKTSGRCIANVRANFLRMKTSEGDIRIVPLPNKMKLDQGAMYRLTFNWQYWYRWSDFVVTLAHEMVHLHQAHTRKALDHDLYFRTISYIIEDKLNSNRQRYSVGDRIQSFGRPFQAKINEYRKKKREARIAAMLNR